MKKRATASGSLSNAEKDGLVVRRDAGPWTPTIHRLLKHLRANGFTCVPEPFGIDDDGREVLAWLPGHAATTPWPAVLRTDRGVADLGSLLRRYHDAVTGFAPGHDAVWRTGARGLAPGEIVIHGDLGPWNILYARSTPVAIIDWDLAEPGAAVHDLAHLAWTAVPCRAEPVWRDCGFEHVPDFRGRLAALAGGNGGVTGVELGAALLALMNRQVVRVAELGRAGIEPWQRLTKAGAPAMIRVERECFASILRGRPEARPADS